MSPRRDDHEPVTLGDYEVPAVLGAPLPFADPPPPVVPPLPRRVVITEPDASHEDRAYAAARDVAPLGAPDFVLRPYAALLLPHIRAAHAAGKAGR